MTSLGLDEWYSSLSDRDKVRMERYADMEINNSISNAYEFLLSMGSSALEEENYSFSVIVLKECLSRTETKIQTFDVTELLIDACIGAKLYDDAKSLCEKDLLLYPEISDVLKARNDGNVPEKMNCRNRYVDVVVGIESGYDEAFVLLDRFLEMGLISKEDHTFRRQSLKIHRLQRSFDGVYTYAYKE